MSSARRSPFSAKVVLGLLLCGSLAFLATLYFIGTGRTGSSTGEAHAASRGLNGYAALYTMLEKQGYAVSQSRDRAGLRSKGLLILTPSLQAEPDEISQAIANRRYIGPTLLIVPKWFAFAPPATYKDKKSGWVLLAGATTPEWLEKLGDDLSLKAKLGEVAKGKSQWSGLGRSGSLPKPTSVQELTGGNLIELVKDSAGRMLVGYDNDNGCYPVLDEAADVTDDNADKCDGDRWNLTIVVEPDLMNNYGLEDRNRAMLAAKIVELTREKQDIPIVFDLSLAGLGGAKNLLTLAVTPPFLAATLCLLIAMIAIGWRAFLRFGPPLAEGRANAFGKRQLVANSAGFLVRSRRLRLLTAPFAALVARRLANALGLRGAEPAAIDAALARRAPDSPPYSQLAEQLRQARGPSEILRAAHALKSLEGTITP
ncbi:DUF4350 domain-containing protein [Tsuneonella mangrovi]|uniref:DUF4350 domain-containing protein n=1 Tax=Tsuneonella mangrovi TaxID=1982042 RepID=UPI000BA1D8CC|nr:DUF4350 domain-containing protein [Tsuneonella mangrovi]